MHDYEPAPNPLPEWELRCQACRKSETHSEQKLVDAMLNGWPTCCGRDMLLRFVPYHR